MTEKEARDRVGEEQWGEFLDWMQGQTVGLKDGEVDYYEYDVDRYVRGKRVVHD